MRKLLTQRDAADLLSVSGRTLERMRLTGAGPRFVRCGYSVRYREEDLERWVASRLAASTSEPIKDHSNV